MALLGVLLCVLALAPATAFARGRRAVPDLRRDAERWAQPQATRSLRLPVTVHVAAEPGDAVTAIARVERWVHRANEELAPFGIEVEVRSRSAASRPTSTA